LPDGALRCHIPFLLYQLGRCAFKFDHPTGNNVRDRSAHAEACFVPLNTV